jgi:hypothetical protein
MQIRVACKPDNASSTMSSYFADVWVKDLGIFERVLTTSMGDVRNII